MKIGLNSFLDMYISMLGSAMPFDESPPLGVLFSGGIDKQHLAVIG